MKKIEKIFSGVWFDILLVIAIMAFSIWMRVPSYTLSGYGDVKDEYRDDENVPYLHDMDSYYYSSLVATSLEGDKLTDVFHTDNMYKIAKSSTDKNDFINAFLPFITAVLYKGTNLITKVSLTKFIALIGPILYVLAIIPAYIFVRKKTNRIGGITAAIIAGCNASFFVSTGFAAYDTDILLCLLPLLVLTTFAESFLAKTFKKGLIFSILSFISMILLIMTWGTYYVYLYLVLGLCCLFLFIYLIKCKWNFKKFIKINEVKILLITIVLYLLSSLIVLGKIDLSIFSSALSMLKGSSFNQDGSYPAPGKFVSELGALPLYSGTIGSLCDITQLGFINRCGGIFAFLLFICAYVKMFIELFDKNIDFKDKMLIMMLLIWVTGGLISVCMGSRFMKIFMVPALLMIGLSVGQFYKLVKEMKIGYLFIATAFFVLWLPYIETKTLAENQAPSANDSLHETATYLREETDEDSIIASWWDFGYYYEYEGERRTLADGGTFDGRYYYFLAKALTTTNIKLTKGIFRMLSTSGLDASYLIDEYMESSKKGCDVLKKILTLDKEDAEKVLRDDYYFTDKQIDNVLSLTHGETKGDVILIITQDIISKIGAINYYGNYNFVEDYDYSTELDEDCMISVLYYKNEYEGIEHLTRIKDKTNSRTANIWKISYDD